jgi:hypothetical protein
VNTLNKRTKASITTQINAIALQREKDRTHTLCGLDETFWTEEKNYTAKDVASSQSAHHDSFHF